MWQIFYTEANTSRAQTETHWGERISAVNVRKLLLGIKSWYNFMGYRLDTVVKTCDCYLFLFSYKLYNIWYTGFREYPTVHLLNVYVYVLVWAFSTNLYFDSKKVKKYHFIIKKKAGPGLKFFFSDTRDHVKPIVEDKSLSYFLSKILKNIPWLNPGAFR